MKLKFRNKTFNFVRKNKITMDGEKLEGFCEHPSEKAKKIVIDKNLTDEAELEVLVHEMIHACFFDLSEDSVNQSAADVARALWRLGYRKT